MPTMTGDWNHNSYLLEPDATQFAAVTVPPPQNRIKVDAFKWAKGTFKIDSGSTSKGKLEFVTGVELVVDFSFETLDGQTVFRGQGVGETGPLEGVIYNLLGWPKLDQAGNVTEVAGGILAVQGGTAGAGLGNQSEGTAGYFKLSK